MSLAIRSTGGADVYLDQAALDRLERSVEGTVLTPESAGYDRSRTVWNGMIDRKPALIVRCTSREDVVSAVNFAREHNLLVAVRGGGHSVAGHATTDGGLLIDLSPMHDVVVDAGSRQARVGPGATLGDVDRTTQRSALATPLGINSTTGVAGLTLGGGFGWLSRKYGLSIDNLLSAEVVTADGEVLRVSENENAELFWGIRGGGGNFGVVTSFEFRLHPVGPELLSGLVVHPLADARDVLRAYREIAASAPDELACWFVLRQAPPLPFLPAEWHGREILILALCWSGSIADGERAMRAARSLGHPVADVVGPHQYTAWQSTLDPLLTPGMRNYWKSQEFRAITDALIDVVIEQARHIPDPQTEIAFGHVGGAVSRVPPEATAYTHRDANYVMNVHGRWSDPARDDLCIAWARGVFATTAPYATGGAYINFLTGEERERVRAAYGRNYDRLVALKTRYDPSNLFHLNQNIRPSGHAASGAPVASPAS